MGGVMREGSMDRVELWRRQLVYQFTVSDREVLAASNLEIQVQNHLTGIGHDFRIVFTCNGTRKMNTESIEVPADWWQHFKQRWFPKSEIKTRKITVKTEYWNVCPHLVMDDQERHVVWMTRDSLEVS